jgi:hypothetical protein
VTHYGPSERYCGDKLQLTYGEARTEAWRLEKKDRLPMRVYQCPQCHWYHVAHWRPLKKVTWRERLGLEETQ